MSFLTENKIKNIIDVPIALPATIIKQSDWVVVATMALSPGQRLSLRALTLQMLDATVDTTLVTPGNLIVSNLGLAYVVLRQNYVSGPPGASGAFDSLAINGLGVIVRSTVPVLITTPGYYSLIAVNNCQPSTASTIPTGTSIDYTLAATGTLRLELIGA